jgi:sulfhydrogenase subunit alpha
MHKVKTPSVQVEIHHLTRVEGHGNIVVDVRNGVIEQCRLEIVEAPRFFEAMFRGRPYEQAPHLASRICGICAVAHSTASIRAVERALGIECSQQTKLLRQLNYCGEMLDSHILHIYMLVAPDVLNATSVIALVESNPEVVGRALRMKHLAGKLCALVAGRHTHPIAMGIGGFSHLPARAELQTLLQELDAIEPDVEATVDMVAGWHLPQFERETEYVALQQPGTYCYSDGRIASSDVGTWPLEQYRSVTNEFQVSHSSAKHARHRRESYMVGALSRYNLNFEELHPKAKTAAARVGLVGPCDNPFMIAAAQLVEVVHFFEEARQVVSQLLEMELQPEEPARPESLSGAGVGAVEAPRGTLFHDYVIKNGRIAEANCVIPTAQNLANIEADLRALLPQILDRPQDDITLLLEMLVRAYDPCISCSAHMLDVSYV